MLSKFLYHKIFGWKITGFSDFKNKENRFSKPFFPTDDVKADFKFMRDFYKGVVGKIPEYS